MALDGEDAQILHKTVPKRLLAFNISGEKRRAGFNISGEKSRPEANGTLTVAIMAKRVSSRRLMVGGMKETITILLFCVFE